VVTLAAIFPPTQPPERIVAVATAADAAGLAELWVWEDCFSESGIATATAMLAATSRITVGIGLLHGVLGWMSQGGVSPEGVRASVGHLRAQRGAGRGPADVVVFISAPADSPARDIVATVSEYAAAGATCVAVNADEDDADIERFAGFLAREVRPLLS